MAPEFPALKIVANQAERAKVTHDAVAVGCGRGGGGAAFAVVKQFQLIRRHRVSPEEAAALASIAAGLQALVGERRQENPSATDAGRRGRPGYLDSPAHAVGGANLDGRPRAGSDAGAVG